jgi:hypothetical protein
MEPRSLPAHDSGAPEFSLRTQPRLLDRRQGECGSIQLSRLYTDFRGQEYFFAANSPTTGKQLKLPKLPRVTAGFEA